MFKRVEYVLVVVIALILTGCAEFRESNLVKQQAVTFEQEIAFRQRKEIELENKIKKQQEEISGLHKQLECREEE